MVTRQSRRCWPVVVDAFSMEKRNRQPTGNRQRAEDEMMGKHGMLTVERKQFQ